VGYEEEEDDERKTRKGRGLSTKEAFPSHE
jgi:hypothetical protein